MEYKPSPETPSLIVKHLFEENLKHSIESASRENAPKMKTQYVFMEALHRTFKKAKELKIDLSGEQWADEVVGSTLAADLSLEEYDKLQGDTTFGPWFEPGFYEDCCGPVWSHLVKKNRAQRGAPETSPQNVEKPSLKVLHMFQDALKTQMQRSGDTSRIPTAGFFMNALESAFLQARNTAKIELSGKEWVEEVLEPALGTELTMEEFNSLEDSGFTFKLPGFYEGCWGLMREYLVEKKRSKVEAPEPV